MDLQLITDELNAKKYAQSISASASGRIDLTEEERNVITALRPEGVLVTYGTLAPGRPNHAVVEPIDGTWKKATIRGRLANEGWGADSGYFGLVPGSHSEQADITAFVLISDDLMNWWTRLDEFEGPGYQRIVIAFVLEDASPGLGMVYALRT